MPDRPESSRQVPSPPPPPPPPSRTPPPPPPAPVVGRSGQRLHHPFALFAVAALAGLIAAFAAGFSTGALAAEAAANDCSPSDGWCDLGAAITGLLVGLLVGGATYVVAGVTIVRRCRPAGRRAAHIAAHLVAPVVLTLLAGATSNL